jgi:hypothetical protein
MDTELKRKLFLEKLEGSFRKIEKFEKFSGQGLIRTSLIYGIDLIPLKKEKSVYFGEKQ